jgi:hypothetical protein
MNSKRLYVIVALFCLCTCTVSFSLEVSSLPTCFTNQELSSKIQSIVDKNDSMIRVQSIAKSLNDQDIWVVEIGLGSEIDRKTRPAVLLVGGVEGNDLASTEILISSIEKACEFQDDITDILRSTTIYVIPRLNPDGIETYFEDILREQVTNVNPYDDDRDGLTDEDGPDDLNGDGLITWVRIEDEEGTFQLHPDDSRILIDTDSTKEEKGRWRYFVEGKDNDGDEKINEDALGGVNINSNFPFQYPWFNPQAGVHSASEPESRGFADFLISHPNIGIVFLFSSNSNLLKSPDTGDASDGRKPQTKVRKEDGKLLSYIGEQYREIVGIDNEIETNTVEGSVADWIYFHRGLFVVSAPVWNEEIAVSLKQNETEIDEDSDEDQEDQSDENDDDTESDTNDSSEKDEKKSDEKRGKEELEYLKWIEENASDYFVEWKEFEHPDYPDKKAEIGGWIPYAKQIPPKESLDNLKEKYAEFFRWLVTKVPRIEIYDIETESKGNGIYSVCVKVQNTGYLPTITQHGVRTREILPTRIEIDIPNESILAGRKRTNISTIQGQGGIQEISYTVLGDDDTRITFTIVSALAGTVEKTITLGGGE